MLCLVLPRQCHPVFQTNHQANCCGCLSASIRQTARESSSTMSLEFQSIFVRLRGILQKHAGVFAVGGMVCGQRHR